MTRGLWFDSGTSWIELSSGGTDPGSGSEFGASPFGTTAFGGTA